MDASEPVTSVVPGVTGGVLAVLARATEPMTGRAVARRVKGGASHAGVNRVLTRLVEAGLVDRVDVGSAALYSLNRHHVAADAVAELAGLRERVLARIRAVLADWAVPTPSAVVFGSFARGDGGPHSDVDLLVVRASSVEDDREAWSRQLAGLTLDGRRWTGNPFRLVELSEADIVEAWAAADPFLREVDREGITVAGLPLSVAAAAPR